MQNVNVIKTAIITSLYLLSFMDVSNWHIDEYYTKKFIKIQLTFVSYLLTYHC